MCRQTCSLYHTMGGICRPGEAGGFKKKKPTVTETSKEKKVENPCSTSILKRSRKDKARFKRKFGQKWSMSEDFRWAAPSVFRPIVITKMDRNSRVPGSLDPAPDLRRTLLCALHFEKLIAMH